MVIKAKKLHFHGRDAKVERSKTNPRMWILYVKNPAGRWVKENISTSKRHMESLCVKW